MANPTADFPGSLHTATDISVFANLPLGATSPDHAEVHGKLEEEIAATQFKLGLTSSTPTAGKFLAGTDTGESAWLTEVDGNLLLKRSADAGLLRVQGISDGDNYSVIELASNEATPLRWQFALKSIAGETGDFAVAHYNGSGWSAPFAIQANDDIRLGKTLANDSKYAIRQNGDYLLEIQRDGGNPTGSEDAWTLVQISAPLATTSGNQEATLALTRDQGGGDLEFLDLYNNGYGSETQYGLRVQKRGAGAYRDFVFDRYDGSTKTTWLKLLAGGGVRIDEAVGFYGTTPVAKQTGVAVSAAGVHAALVNLGLIT